MVCESVHEVDKKTLPKRLTNLTSVVVLVRVLVYAPEAIQICISE